MHIPISATNAHWYPLSTTYEHDEDINLQPTYIKWKDGYTAVQHPLFTKVRSVAINRDTLFLLTTATPFSNIAYSNITNTSSMRSYISLKMNGKYVTTSNDCLYLSGDTVTDDNFFKLIYNADSTYSIVHNNEKYITVNPYSPFSLTLQDKMSNGDLKRQSFNIYSSDDKQIYISTTFNNPFSAYDGVAATQRFWSYNSTTSAIQCIGTSTDAKNYTYSNPYLFTYEGTNLTFTSDSIISNQTWVQYYNELIDTKNNTNVEVNQNYSVSGVSLNRLVELPYMSKITIEGQSGYMEANILNMKNTLSPEYEQHR